MIDAHEWLREEVAAYALGSLDAPAGPRVEAHLAGCDACRRLLEEYRAVVARLPEALSAEAPSPAVRERLLARIAAEAPPAGATRRLSLFAARHRPILGGLAAAAAAVFVIAIVVGTQSGRGGGSSKSAARPAAGAASQAAAARSAANAAGAADQSGAAGATRAAAAAAAPATAAASAAVAAAASPAAAPAAVPAGTAATPGVHVQVQPESGSPAQRFMFSGDGYQPGQRVSVSFVTPDGTVVPFKNAAGGDDVEVDAAGRFSVDFTPAEALANAPGGEWQARFETTPGVQQVVQFTVQP